MSVEGYRPVRRARTQALLDDPSFHDFTEKRGILQQFEMQATLERQRINAPDYQQKLERSLQLVHQSDDYCLLGLDKVEGPITRQKVVAMYRKAAKRMNPDIGGSDEAMK